MADDDKKPYHERYRPAPPPDYMRYLTAPFTGYWDRQGKLAREGLAMAEDGAQRTRAGDLSGYLGQFLGPIAYASSPINALIPTEQEAYAAFRGDAAPFAAGVLGAASFGLPGPKVRGLGKGLGGLADDVTDAERAALASRLQAEAGQTGGQASNATRDQALANLTEAPQGITAYHASPHTFDKFSMDKIGEGQGAQAYGHGLYFAESPAVSGRGGQYDREFTQTMRSNAGTPKHAEFAEYWLDKHGGDRSAAVSALEADIAKPQKRGQFGQSELVQDKARALDLLKSGDPLSLPKASIYEVRLNVKPDELLDWDRPLSEQPEGVRAALKAAGAVGPKHSDWSMTGGKIFESVKTDPTFAADMRASGVKGVRYKDAGSRSAEGGTYNYVIFDDNLVSILKRYAIPFTLGAGGAAIVSGANMPPELAAQMGPEA